MLGESLTLLFDSSAPTLELLGTALKLGELDQPGLVDVDEAPPLRFGAVGSAVEACELAGEQLVVGRRHSRADGALAGEEHFGTK